MYFLLNSHEDLSLGFKTREDASRFSRNRRSLFLCFALFWACLRSMPLILPPVISSPLTEYPPSSLDLKDFYDKTWSCVVSAPGRENRFYRLLRKQRQRRRILRPFPFPCYAIHFSCSWSFYCFIVLFDFETRENNIEWCRGQEIETKGTESFCTETAVTKRKSTGNARFFLSCLCRNFVSQELSRRRQSQAEEAKGSIVDTERILDNNPAVKQQKCLK